MSEVWSKFSQTIERGEAHLGALETSQDECSETSQLSTGDRQPEMNHRTETISCYCYMTISGFCEHILVLS